MRPTKPPTGQVPVDVTKIVAKMLKNNSLSVPVKNDVLGGDPALNHVKQLRVSYTMNGDKRETTATEGTTLKVSEPGGPLDYYRKDFTSGRPSRRPGFTRLPWVYTNCT